jgi:hypothetical protein
MKNYRIEIKFGGRLTLRVLNIEAATAEAAIAEAEAINVGLKMIRCTFSATEI